jgi:phage terminase large subunit-like protein
MASSSLYYFAKYVCGFTEMEVQPHWELCRFLQYWGSQKDLLILAPRGTFKSSIATVAYPLWRLTKNRDLRILVTGGELANSKNFLSTIRQIVETSVVFRELYGDWRGKGTSAEGNGTWTQTALTFSGRTKPSPQASITASSYKVTKVSQHYDLVVSDDLMNDKTVATKEIIDECEHYHDLLLPVLDPDPETGRPGSRILIGTRWDYDDLYGRLIAKEKQYRKDNVGNYRLMIYDRAAGKVDQDLNVLPGTEYFPSRFPSDYLTRIKNSMRRYFFACQYLNDPLPEGDRPFRLSRIGFFTISEYLGSSGEKLERVNEVNKHGAILPGPVHLTYFLALDPSLSEEDKSDYSAFVVIAVDPQWNIYVWDVVRRHVQPDDILEQLFDLNEKYPLVRTGIESVVFQKTLLWGFNHIARKRNKWFKIDELVPDSTQSKELRILGLEPLVSQGRVFLRCRPGTDLRDSPQNLYHTVVEGQDSLIDEMVRFPKCATDDCMDALAYTLKLLHPAGVPVEKPETEGTFMELRRLSLARNRGTRVRSLR